MLAYLCVVEDQSAELTIGLELVLVHAVHFPLGSEEGQDAELVEVDLLDFLRNGGRLVELVVARFFASVRA